MTGLSKGVDPGARTKFAEIFSDHQMAKTLFFFSDTQRLTRNSLGLNCDLHIIMVSKLFGMHVRQYVIAGYTDVKGQVNDQQE